MTEYLTDDINQCGTTSCHTCNIFINDQSFKSNLTGKDHLKKLVTDRISNLKGHFKSPKCKVLDQPDVKDTLHKLHANYVLVPLDKAANNVIIVCKKYHIDTLVKELGINNVIINNPTIIPIDD